MKIMGIGTRGARAMLTAAVLALGAMPPLMAAKDTAPVKVSSPKTFAGAQQVVIGQFTVAFLTERRDTKGSGGGSSSVISYLSGYTTPELQQVTDAAYADFVTKLQANGFTVADRAAYSAFPQIVAAPAEDNGKENQTITGKDDKAKLVLFSATQAGPLRLLPGDLVRGGFGAMGLTMNGVKVSMAQTAFAKAQGVNVLDVIYFVNFAKAEQYGFLGTSSVKVQSALALLPEQTKVTLITPAGKTGTITLKTPVAISGDFFDSASAMSTGDKLDNAGAALIGMLGGVGVNQYKKVRFTARPGTYAAGAVQATGEANALFARQLAALR